jgi:hypothetical protein
MVRNQTQLTSMTCAHARERAVRAGAIEEQVFEHCDPFGHGVCLIERKSSGPRRGVISSRAFAGAPPPLRVEYTSAKKLPYSGRP